MNLPLLKKLLKITLFFAFWGLIIIFPAKVLAEEEVTCIRLNEKAIVKGYTTSHDEENILFAVTPNQVDQEVTVTLKTVPIDEEIIPAGKKLISGSYIFDMLGEVENPIITEKPSWIALKYNSDNLKKKAIYFWASHKEVWMELPSYVHAESGYVRGITHLPFSLVAVLEDDTKVEGQASWLGSSKNFVAASNDFPLGSKVKVTHLDNGKSVVVTISSRGPFVSGRVIDLSSDAFKILAPLWQGVARVEVELLEEGSGVVLGAKSPPEEVSSSAAVILDEENGEVLWEKNSQEVRSLAGLTKIVAGFTFLETGTSLEQVVTYQESDEIGGYHFPIRPGETLRTKDLFYASLVGSANNAMRALARATGRGLDDFVDLMNQKADSLGLKETKFVEPSGLNLENTSTAYEYALLTRQALRNFEMLKGTTTRHYSFSTLNTQRAFHLENENKILTSDFYITGTGRGYLKEAGWCFMTKARSKSSSQQVIVVTLGASSQEAGLEDMKNLINWSFN